LHHSDDDVSLVLEFLERLLNIIDVIVDAITHPRFYLPLLTGGAVAIGLYQWMPPGDMRETLILIALLGGLAVGVLWDWSHHVAKL
jgi:hypothetical protein